MAVAPIFSVLLIAAIANSKCESTNTYNRNNGNEALQFGELLKPPPPPPLSQILPVPFHGGASRSQRQNADAGYSYQPPPPPPPPPAPLSSDFKFPAPFYKQYNFNFVPPPQPFTSTPSPPSLFNKVSNWLFPSKESQHDSGAIFNNNDIATVKKDCNPCNLVPWIPVIRYNVGAKNIQQNLIPTYGPPSPTAQNVVQFRPKPFYSQNQVSTGVPHEVYGPPSYNNGFPSSTYGPPSPTHTSYSVPSSSFPIQSSSYGASSGQISSSFELPSPSYGPPSTYGVPSSTYGEPSSSFGVPSSYGLPSSTYGTPTSTYTTPSSLYNSPRPLSSTYLPANSDYDPGVLNNGLPTQNEIEIIKNSQATGDIQLPKVSPPKGFRNSYGEPISNNYALGFPYPVSATAAESSKIRTAVLPQEDTKSYQSNGSLALAKPAPFTLNRGRNIHTLQPVALPNLSVSPLPPIFNARPFRQQPELKFPILHADGINQMQQSSNNVNVEQSVPIAEYTHSVDYPPTIIHSPVIDIDNTKVSNKSKGYRNIPNSYIIDDYRDISSQASEDHLAATKSNQDSSFESTGTDIGNDIYDSGLPKDLKPKLEQNSLKNNFADLRGIKDEDVDKYRTENNLQNIDSPLLYLKPGVPHKDYTNFIISTILPDDIRDYEIYDDNPTTTITPQLSTQTSAWDESRNDYDAFSLPTAAQEDANQPKIVQIVIPYTTGEQNAHSNDGYEHVIQDWAPTSEDEYLARKVPKNTEDYYNFEPSTESYTTASTTTDLPSTNTDSGPYDSEKLNTPAILNDLYDVKEPPFDIIKLQNNIDGWTEQEYSRRYKTPQKTRSNGKYAKQIPDEYFTTLSPITNHVTPSTYNYESYDHETSSSVRHVVTNDKDTKSHKEYNSIERTKIKDKNKNEDDDLEKLHIYTAASSFRSTTTTPAPWGKIQTSISPLTKEKVYVVTSKPWREAPNVTNDWFEVEPFESKKTNLDNDVSASESLPFQSPRFSKRPNISTGEKSQSESVSSDSSYGFSRNWHQRINDLENQKLNNSTSFPEGSQQNVTINTEEDIPTTVTAGPPKNESSAN